MAYTSDLRLAQPRAAQTGIASKLQTLTADLSQRYARYRVFRDTVNDLAILPDIVLADMGLNRSQIRSVAYEYAYGVKK
ncbi:MAG: DUF1127 domain-containing protein [Paracoccaceae bacterium]|uniref:DUF1127 domain-containing protein n=1 Tax=Seohaeicola saemankumensis TaxID=481181 RepID=UPI001E50B61C|nr:DUF1127 domain-containing protein [Seohaeicola saemankumensis]MCD1626486.1 DUF1127 domain-containing protein [Seohaeicola saemankumensis]